MKYTIVSSNDMSALKCFAIIFAFLFTQISYAKTVYRCENKGAVLYQSKPCKNNTQQKVACVNYASESNFKKSLEGRECLDNGANSGDYKGYSSGYSGSSLGSYHSGSSYSSSRIKNQRVSGYTRKDGTYVKPYNRSRK